MGFTSTDDYVSKVTAGNFWRADWNKITGASAYAAGRWYDMSLLSGTPIANIYGEVAINGTFLGSLFNWTPNGTGWAYGAFTAVKTSGTATTLSSDSTYHTIVAARYYRVMYTISGYTSGTCTVSVGGTSGTGRTANGTYTEVLTAASAAGIVFTSGTTAVFTISAVSVVEWGAASGTITPASQIMTNTEAQGALYHGGDVSAATKHIMNAGVVTAIATGVPGVWMLCDMLLAYPWMDQNSASAQTCTNNNTLPRYTDGKGVRTFVVAQSVLGAGTPNFTMTYTNSAGTGSRVLPVTVACTASAIVGHIVFSGTAANNYGPFLPLASGDAGVRSIQEVKLSVVGGTADRWLHIVLCRPLFALPITTLGVMAERDFMNQLPSMPRVYDGANLQWLFFAGAATVAATNFYGYLDFAWA